MENSFFNSVFDIFLFLRPILEILLISFLIYKALYYLRGARGSYILAGMIIVLVILTVLSNQLKFEIISWLLDGLWVSLAPAMIIIFQPELRRAFAQLGSYTFWQGRRQREVIGELINAAGHMSSRKCGAIIVLERRIGLQNIIDDAVKIDAKLNAMVLESFFFPNSPLHDGAVIIRDNRIVAARAILPLTRAENISKRLGTRHRAALGISEESDAITLIVSEETGAMSLTCRGFLYRDLSVSELEKYLEQLLIQEQDDDDMIESAEIFETHPINTKIDGGAKNE